MAAFCPALPYTPESMGSGGWWSGPLTPVRSVERLPDLLDDIHHHNPIYTAPGAELRHLASCQASHCKHEWMDKVRPEELVRTFDATIYYSGGHDDPRCRIKGIDLTNGRHMWTDGSICPFMSSSAAWDWVTDTVADFTGHVSIWLVSWIVFQHTGVWIVGEHGNTPDYHLGNIKPNNQCWCRSGKKYRRCHMQQDQILAWRMRR
jgi:SEC-C motif-containing protein